MQIATKNIQRGQIYYADLSPVTGCEQGGIRPVLIIQNNIGNCYSPTVIIACITASQQKKKIPTHVTIFSNESGLSNNSIVLLEQLRTIDKSRIFNEIGKLSENKMQKINDALVISLAIK